MIEIAFKKEVELKMPDDFFKFIKYDSKLKFEFHHDNGEANIYELVTVYRNVWWRKFLFNVFEVKTKKHNKIKARLVHNI